MSLIEIISCGLNKTFLIGFIYIYIYLYNYNGRFKEILMLGRYDVNFWCMGKLLRIDEHCVDIRRPILLIVATLMRDLNDPFEINCFTLSFNYR